MELWIGAVNLGFLYAFMAMGVFITFRINDFPDITVDGSFVTGAAVTAVLIVAGVNPWAALAMSFLAASAAGAVTALIHTRFQIAGLLSGIMVMTGLYSVNLHIMGRSNIPLLNEPGLLASLKHMNPGLPYEVWLCLIFGAVVLVFWLLISLFFRTDFGISMRAAGDNPNMAAASGINVNGMKIFGIALANGLVGLSGSLVAQYQGFADIGMGIGSIVFGLAAVIIGETILPLKSIWAKTLSVIIGSIIFRFMVALALYVGLNPIDLKLITAVFVLVILIGPKMLHQRYAKAGAWASRLPSFLTRKKAGIALGVLIAAGLSAFLGYTFFHNVFVTDKAALITGAPQKDTRPRRLVVFVFSDNYSLEVSVKGILQELKQSGVLAKHPMTVDVRNAQNDYGTALAIVQDIVRQDYDYIITVSTMALQVTAAGNRKIPHIFGTVTDPYRMGVAKNAADHIPNITGVATFQPVESAMRAMRAIFPKARRVGLVWNPSEANSEACTLKARAAARKYGFELVEKNVTRTDEVKDAALAVINSGVDLFFSSGDNTVILAQATVAQVMQEHNIPYFTNDPSDLERGSFFSIGADYFQVGIETAKMAARVFDGEKPQNIPIREYVPEAIGISLTLAERYGVTIPDEYLKKAVRVKRWP